MTYNAIDELTKLLDSVSVFSEKELRVLNQIKGTRVKILEELKAIQDELDLLIFQQTELQKREFYLYQKLIDAKMII